MKKLMAAKTTIEQVRGILGSHWSRKASRQILTQMVFLIEGSFDHCRARRRQQSSILQFCGALQHIEDRCVLGMTRPQSDLLRPTAADNRTITLGALQFGIVVHAPGYEKKI